MKFNVGDFKQNENGDFSWTPTSGPKKPQKPKKPRKVMTPLKRNLLSLLITLLAGFIYFYFELPALNIHSADLYIFIILMCAAYCICIVLFGGFQANNVKSYVGHVRKKAAIPFYIVCLCLVVAVAGSVIGWKLFRARDYANLLPIENGDFASEVAEISFDQIPMLDKDSANVLANRKLGELSELVSQFEVYHDSFQINYRDKPVRVTYLDYGDFFKWWNNQSKGIPAYMIVDMVTQEVSVQKLESGIRYSPSEYFFRNINRYLRFKYPTKIFDDINFEVNEEGEPYWIATTVVKRIGLFGGADADGAVLVNAVTGESEWCAIEEVPTWVDRVFTADLIIQQYDYHGVYKNGFWNSLFGQSGCTETTSGYNYIAQDDDVWLYTGVTSVSGDQGNIGFILVNQRTKETRYYPCAGAEEGSAQDSAQGAVQQYSYRATFPLLLNIEGMPTYFLALKDASQLVKMYAMVNVQQYQIVATGTSVTACADNYERLLIEGDIIDGELPLVPAETKDVTGKVEELRQAVIDGNTIYYVKLAGKNQWYTVSAADCPEAVILNTGDKVKLSYEPADATFVTVRALEILEAAGIKT